MTSFTQMSFQTKTAGQSAFLFRNDSQAGILSGLRERSSQRSCNSHDSFLCGFENWCLSHCLVIRAWTLVIPIRRNPLISRLSTRLRLNKKYFFGRPSLLPIRVNWCNSCLALSSLAAFASEIRTMITQCSHIKVTRKIDTSYLPRATSTLYLQKSKTKKFQIRALFAEPFCLFPSDLRALTPLRKLLYFKPFL